ncbi:biotin--[acetyl-CoA-carboxylase] ligase, partial [Pelagibacteraceae bacterium]|nr:biotin--[acetyl-CoA-carboxylase] ligase [Pelagibacteraceae bacterium]
MILKIIKFKSVKSTNDKAIKLIQKNNHTLGLVVSDKQTKGRGTMGKRWISKKGNIFISIFYKINFTSIKVENFLKINAKIIKKILKSYTKKIIIIKKPNDLLIENKKICGILQEVIEHNNEKFLITGIGIN